MNDPDETANIYTCRPLIYPLSSLVSYRHSRTQFGSMTQGQGAMLPYQLLHENEKQKRVEDTSTVVNTSLR